MEDPKVGFGVGGGELLGAVGHGGEGEGLETGCFEGGVNFWKIYV